MAVLLACYTTSLIFINVKGEFFIIPYMCVAWGLLQPPPVNQAHCGSSVRLCMKPLSIKFAKSQQAESPTAAGTEPSCLLEQHSTAPDPTLLALPSDPLLLYVFSCSEHLTKDNLFGCLMLRHRLVEDYTRWSNDLWRPVVGWSKYVW